MNILERIQTDAPFFISGALEALLEQALGTDRLADLRLAEHPMFQSIRAQMKPKVTMTEDGIAVIPVHGSLAFAPDWREMVMGVEDSRNVLEMIEGAGSEARGVLLSINSPGGFYTGGPELADAVRELAAKKPTVAHSSGMMASLAYMVGSQAGSVGASRSAQIGSIGVLSVHLDRSRMLENFGIKVEVFRNKEGTLKAPGALGTALTDDQRGYLQERVQAGFEEFKSLVRHRRPGVSEDSMHGQVFTGLEARKRGLIDFVGSTAHALASLRAHLK